MATLASFLMMIAGSLAGRVLLSLGFSIFSYAALSTLAATVVSNLTNNYQSLTGEVLQILNLAGFGQAFGILAAGLTTRASMMALKKLALK